MVLTRYQAILELTPFPFKPMMKFGRDVSGLFSLLSRSEAAQGPDRFGYGKDNLVITIYSEVDGSAFLHAIFSSHRQFNVGVKSLESEIEVCHICMHSKQVPQNLS